MSRTESLCVTFFFFFWVAILSAPVASSNGKERSPLAYEVLQSYGFPVGLLPRGITGFTLENSYQLKYERRIEGVIEREMLRGLKGVSVKVTVVWQSIVEVVRQGGKLEFSIGVASAGFPVENFAECPRSVMPCSRVGCPGDLPVRPRHLLLLPCFLHRRSTAPRGATGFCHLGRRTSCCRQIPAPVISRTLSADRVSDWNGVCSGDGRGTHGTRAVYLAMVFEIVSAAR
ncbi:hypothetical protein NL676_002512 [Syzygium grande]|nr:hypothetical protein NL676_002512 [Syzygium grande]